MTENAISKEPTIDKEPVLGLPYLYPQTGGNVRVGEFPVYGGTAEWLPTELDGLLITSDLQGMEQACGNCGQPRLIGHKRTWCRLVNKVVALSLLLP